MDMKLSLWVSIVLHFLALRRLDILGTDIMMENWWD